MKASEQFTEKFAREWAVKHSAAPDKETPDWIITDFKAGANLLLEQMGDFARWVHINYYPAYSKWYLAFDDDPVTDPGKTTSELIEDYFASLNK